MNLGLPTGSRLHSVTANNSEKTSKGFKTRQSSNAKEQKERRQIWREEEMPVPIMLSSISQLYIQEEMLHR